jgi:hypothetical protein
MPYDQFDEAEQAFGEDLAGLLGVSDLSKLAEFSTPVGTPQEKEIPKTASGPRSVAGMSLREVFDNPYFRQGLAEEWDSLRSIWEPVLLNLLGR